VNSNINVYVIQRKKALMNKPSYLKYYIVSILVILFAPFTQGAQPVQAQGTGCSTSSPISSAYTITLCFTSPLVGSSLSGEVPVTVTVNSTGDFPGTQRLVFYLNGEYLLTDFVSPYSFTLPTTKWVDGSYTLTVEAVLRDAYISQQPAISVIFFNGISSPPVNSNQFTPSAGLPADGAPFIVAAGGDAASGEVYADRVTDLIKALDPNLFLYLGDVYNKGTATEFLNWYGTESTRFGQFRTITNPVVGNHEYENGAAPGYFEYWDNIPDYYSYEAGGWHFVTLNSNSTYEPVDPQSAQYQWLQADLAAHAQTCTVVSYHHPLFNIGPEGSAEQMADIWSLMAQYGVDIVLNGHDHTYQRWEPLNGSGQPDPDGITQFVVGASGHGLQTIGSSDNRVAFATDANPTAFGVLLLQLNPDGANFSYQNTEGAILDSGVIPCEPSGSDSLAPTVPSELLATATSATQVELSWSASSDDTGVAGYTMYRDGISIATVPGSTLTYGDTTVFPQNTYSYTVDAFDTAGNHSAVSSQVAVTTPSMPTQLIFSVEADSYVSSSNPASKYGLATSLRADASPDLHSYLRFTVQGLAGAPPIVQARLLLYANNNGSQGIAAQAVPDNSWDEATMSYQVAPPLGNILSSSGAYSAGTWVELDVTSYVTGDGTYSFGVTTPGSTALSFPSRESGANAPKLVLSFSSAPTPIPTATISATATSTLLQTDTPTSTPTSLFTPTATVSAGLPLIFTPVADAYVNAGNLGNNYGQSTSLRADASPDVHSYLRFSVQGLGGSPITQARLWVYAKNSSSLGISANAVPDDSWDELVVNYSNAPALGSILDSSGVFSAGDWVELDVTSYVTGEGSYSFGLTTSSNTSLSFSSRESSTNAPQLILSFSPLTPMPTATASATLTNTPLPSDTPSQEATFTMTNTPTETNTPVPATATNTSAPIPTDTPLPPTASYTPTSTIAADQPLLFTPLADTYVNAGNTGANYGGSISLRADASPDVHSYLRFYVQGLAGQAVTAAHLLIYANSGSSQGIQALGVADNNWSETSMDYTNAPDLGATLASSGAVSAGNWVTLDVTSYISGEGMYSFGVTTPGSTAINLASSESGAHSPQLIIDLQ
jgi:hypothetical protein